MDHKTFAFKLTNLDFTGRTLEGYANVFNVKDLVGDIVHPGAFAKTLLERGGKVKFLWQHDIGEPIGRPVELREDTNGLFIKAIISDTQRGRDALALLHDGAIGEMSIGFDTVKGGLDYSKDAMTGDTIRNLRELKLYEVSLVTFPANESAVVTGLKDAKAMDESEMGKMARMMEMVDEMREMMGSMMGSEKPEKDEKAGRRLRSDKVELVRQLRGIVDELSKWAEYDEGDSAPDEDQAASGDEEHRKEKPKDEKAGPLPEQSEALPAPTYEDLLALIEIETQQLDLLVR